MPDQAADWAAYTEATARLAAAVRTERARAAEQEAAGHTARAGIEALTGRLAAQRQHLVQLAAELRLPAPSIGPPVPGPVADPTEAVARATAAADAADVAARAAHRRAAQPPLLPGLTPSARNVIVYAAAALAGTLISILMIAVNPDAEFGRIPWQLVPWSLCGLPAVAFFAGYLTISLAGQPRLGKGGTKSVRAGGFICFVGMPILWFLFIAATRG